VRLGGSFADAHLAPDRLVFIDETWASTKGTQAGATPTRSFWTYPGLA
jgi:hypothetical protein